MYSFGLAEGAGVEPTGASCSDSFRDCSACPCPTFRDASGGTRTPTLAKSHSFTGCCRASSASNARCVVEKTSMKKLMKAGSGKLSPPSSPQGNSVVKQQNKRSGPFGLPQRKQARSTQVSTNCFEIWGAGGRPPLNQLCNCRRSLRAHPSGRRACCLISPPP